MAKEGREGYRGERGEGAYQSKMEVQWHHPKSILSLLERVVSVCNVVL